VDRRLDRHDRRCPLCHRLRRQHQLAPRRSPPLHLLPLSSRLRRGAHPQGRPPPRASRHSALPRRRRPRRTDRQRGSPRRRYFDCRKRAPRSDCRKRLLRAPGLVVASARRSSTRL